MAKVLIVEDEDFYRRRLLSMLAPFFVMYAVSRLSEAISTAQNYDAVLLDINLPDSRIEETVANMKHNHPSCAIVVLSGFEDPDRIKQCILDSASNYLIKGKDDKDPELLASAIRTAIYSNNANLKADMAKRLINGGK